MPSRERLSAERCGVILVSALFVLALAACTKPQPDVPVVPTESESTGTDKAATQTPSPTATDGIPQECSELATAGEVASFLNVPIQGETIRIYNDDFLSDSGRTGRLNCRYGVKAGPAGRPPSTSAPAALEISVSSYVDKHTAAGRIDSTVDAAQAAGGSVAAQAVAGHHGFVLADPKDVSYVFAQGTRTYVITLRHRVVPVTAERVVLLDVASHLLGVPHATPSPRR